jgi:hypothetical protein
MKLNTNFRDKMYHSRVRVLEVSERRLSIPCTVTFNEKLYFPIDNVVGVISGTLKTKMEDQFK